MKNITERLRNECRSERDICTAAADRIEQLQELVIQYRSDLLHPVTCSNSLKRRLEAIDAAISGGGKEQDGDICPKCGGTLMHGSICADCGFETGN